MIKEFNALDEIQKYYDKESNTYIFKEGGDYIDQVILYFNFNANANIDVANIKVYDITAKDIHAEDIDCRHLIAKNITAPIKFSFIFCFL